MPESDLLTAISVEMADRYEKLAMYVPQALVDLGPGGESKSCPGCGTLLVSGLAPPIDLSEMAVRCVCLKWCIIPRATRYARSIRQDEWFLPRTLYRYFDQEEHYRDFLEGRVWITTLNACRTSEDTSRADRGEGTRTFEQQTSVTDPSNPAHREILRRLGIRIGQGVTRVLVEGNVRTYQHPDEFMLCLSESLSPKLVKQFSPNAKLVVQITRSTELFDAIGEALNCINPLFHYECARVIYNRRTIHDIDSVPTAVPWLMKPQEYSHEKEVRAVWRPQLPTDALMPGFVKVFNIGAFVRPVSAPR